MADWKKVDAKEYATFLRQERAAGDVQADKLRPHLLIHFRGLGDYRTSQWIAKKETIGEEEHYYIIEQ